MAAISKSILSFLLLTGAATAIPLTPRASTVFTLTDIVYEQSQTYSAPPHISAYSNTVSFTLTNTAISRVTKCHGNLNHFPSFILTRLKSYCTEPNTPRISFLTILDLQ